jgi:hypothetical protein
MSKWSFRRGLATESPLFFAAARGIGTPQDEFTIPGRLGLLCLGIHLSLAH